MAKLCYCIQLAVPKSYPSQTLNPSGESQSVHKLFHTTSVFTYFLQALASVCVDPSANVLALTS